MNDLTMKDIFDAVQRLNWSYGRGDLVSVKYAGRDLWLCESKLQYGISKFTARVRFRTVRARNHQTTV